MSKIFEDIKIKWDGTEYTIPSKKVMMAIALIEEHVTFSELGEAVRKRGGFSLVKISAAYGSVLRFAGAEVSDEEVYGELLSNEKMATNLQSVLNGLLAMMIPPSAIKDASKKALSGEADSVASGKSRVTRMDEARSSAQRTRRRSATS